MRWRELVGEQLRRRRRRRGPRREDLIDTTDIMGSGGYSSGNYITNFNGTSSACPNAAGCVALLLSADPSLTASEVRTYLRLTSDDEVGPPSEDTPGFDNFMGYGRLNLASLMALVGAPSMVDNLICSPSGGDAVLTWSNPQSYDSIIIARDGVDIATLSGSATSHTDAAVPQGLHTYEVHGVEAGTHGLSSSCSLFFIGALTDLVWSATGNGGTVDGGQALFDALVANGKSAFLTSSLGSVGDLNGFERIWVNLGIYPENHVLTSTESDLLAPYLTDGIGGGTLYLEGGDTWAFDTATTLHGLFSIDGVADGTGDLAQVAGTGIATCDLTGIDLDYVGENAWIDHLAPLAGAWTIQSNTAPSYDTAVYFESATYRTIGASHEFGGFSDGASTRADLMAAYLSCLGAGSTVPAVSALSCVESGEDVLISWSNDGVYTSIEVHRDGSLWTTLPGGDTSIVDIAATGGPHDYEVVAYDGAEAAAGVTCSVDVTPDAVTLLSCAADATGIALSWVASESYSAIDLYRDAVFLVTVPGSSTSYSDGAPPSGPHDYDVVPGIGGVDGTTATCSATYVAPPAIVGSPTSTETCLGATASFTVVATGDALAYQWRHDGTPVPGATSASYSLASVTGGDAGSYDVVVSNSVGSATSNAATLTVL
ncbi:MAG: S8 family serine peptidase, partial [Planctomycetes bacterium]|nr:S8 family serine peptidase [Planctomycetota bacterium]